MRDAAITNARVLRIPASFGVDAGPRHTGTQRRWHRSAHAAPKRRGPPRPAAGRTTPGGGPLEPDPAREDERLTTTPFPPTFHEGRELSPLQLEGGTAEEGPSPPAGGGSH